MLIAIMLSSALLFTTIFAAMCNNILVHPVHAFVPPQKRRSFVQSRGNLSRVTSRKMALVPLEVAELRRLLVTGTPTAPQYATYWGRTSRERYASMFESGAVMLFGTICSYFLSFVVGSFPATILGSFCIFWIILSPEAQAYQRNWELRGGRELVDPWSIDPSLPQDKQGLYGALLLGRIADVSVVEDANSKDEYDLDEFQDYTMETDEQERWNGNPYLLRLLVQDSEGREMQVHTRMSEEYLDMKANQPIVGVLLSTSQRFTTLAAMTELLVPDAECWVGDYPYLDRFEVEALLGEDDDVWDQLENERITQRSQKAPEGGGKEDEEQDSAFVDLTDDEEASMRTSNWPEALPVRRKRQR